MTPAVIVRIESLIKRRPEYDFLSILMRRAVAASDEWVVTDGIDGLSAKSVLTGVIRYANFFSRKGIRQRHIVGVECQDRLLQVQIHCALLALGAVRKPLNLQELAGDPILTRCDFVICSSNAQPRIDKARCLRLDPKLDHDLGTHPIDESSLDCFVSSFDEDDPIMLGNTSSTTGDKKYFFHTHRIVTQRVPFIRQRYFQGDTLHFLALYEDANISSHVASVAALCSGGMIVFARIENWHDLARAFPDSHAMILPRDVDLIMRTSIGKVSLSPHKIRSLRALGGALSTGTRSWLLDHIADEVVNSYSSNEVGQIAEVDASGISRIYPGVSVKIVDDAGQPLPMGCPGLISVKTLAPIRSYLWDDTLNKQSFHDGWYQSNDYGLLIDAHTLQLLGRADDMLNVGGIKMSPREFEDTIKQFDGVNDCAIMARNLESGDTRFMVCIEMNSSILPSNSEILTKQIENAIPKGFGEFDLVFFDAFPLTETRKVRRKALMTMALDKLALGNRTEAINRAKSLHQGGNLAAAEAIYFELLKSSPQDFDCLHLMGLIQIQKGQAVIGAQLIGAALKIKPDSALAYYNLGNGLYQLKRITDALACYDMALSIEPVWPEALCNRGNALLEIGRAADALVSFDHALLLKPDYSEALYNRGNAFLELEDFEDALSSFDAALAINPKDAESLSNRGNALYRLHRLDDALRSYDSSLAIRSDYAEVHNNRGNILKELRRHNEALISLDQAIFLRPDYADAWHNRGNVLLELKQPGLALESFKQALAFDPDYKFLQGIFLHARMKVCDWDGWSSSVAEIVLAVDSGKKASNPFPSLTILDEPNLLKRLAEIYTRSEYGHQPINVVPASPETSKKIRLGYVSCDFKEHAVSYLMAGVFEAHDRERFEVYGYDIGPVPDCPTRRRIVAAFDQFKIVSDLSDKAVAEQIRQDQIDILIDLTGYTKGARTGIFAYRPAPIQVNYLGFPGTMGAPFMDYIIADRVLIPEEHRQYYTEQVLYLPHCFQANDDKRVIAPPKSKSHFGLPEDAFVFGCFNQSAKFTPILFEVWLSILRQVPNSVLWLIEDSPTQVENLRTYSQERGIDPNRLIFTGKLPYPEHLARYTHIDLVLDTLPFNGGTTTSDALWGGAPVLTCIGQTFSGRMSASLLTAIGLPELITNTLKDYERLAIDLAAHPERLKALRQRLAQNRTSGSLFDTNAFTRNLEKSVLSRANMI